LIELTDLPDSWIRTTIKESCSIMSGQTPKGIENSSGKIDEVPWFRISDMNTSGNEKILTIAQVYLSQTSIEKLGIHIRPKGTIVFPKRGGAIATNKKRILTRDSAYDLNIMGIFPILIENRFFWHWFQTINLKEISDGSNVPQINNGNIEPLEFPLPPLNEQRRIVSTIEQLTDRSHKARAALEDVPKLIAQFRQSVLATAFRGDLTADWREKNPDIEPASELLERIKIDSLPQKWYETNIGEIIEGLKYGTSQKCDYENDGIPVLRIPNIGEGKIELSDLKYAKLPEKELESLKLRTGDILLIRSNGSVSLVGKTALVAEAEEGYAYAGYLIRLRVNQKLVNPKYLNLCFSSHSIRLQIELPARSTSGVKNINSTEVQKLRVSLPPLAEQVEIISRLEKCFKSIQIIEEQYNNSHEQLDTLDRSILAKAFRGELVPQDPNDEPAAILLERIRAEREQTSSNKQRGKTTRKNSSKQLSIEGIE
jgi:type I restriction enzyme, S subunit